MSTDLSPTWAKSKKVPTSTVKITGQGGNVVATIDIVGEATVTTSWPYAWIKQET